MKKSKFKLLLLVAFTALLFTTNVNAEEYEAVKELKQEYQSNDQTLLEIANKYGNIKINDWDNTNIVIEVKITVKANNKEFAESKLKFINVDFSESENVIKAITKIDEEINNSTGIFSNRKIDFNIDYYVSVPRNLKMNLFNKYGNVDINEIHGKTNITLKYGNLNANKLIFDNSKPLSKLTLSYGNAEINECNWLTSVLKYSNIEIKEGTALVFVTSYSNVNVENCKTMVTEAKYDTYKINKISNFTTEAKYSDFKINNLDNKLFVEVEYGGMKIDHIKSGFESIQVDGKYVDIKLGIEDGASYTIDANVKYGDVDFPKAANVDRKVGTLSESVQGTIGPDANTKSSVIVNCEYGDIKLEL